MATVEDTKTPYEILIRFGDDGLPRGAHAQFIRRVKIDGELIKEEIGNAEPLDIGDFPASAIMSDTTRDALAEVTRLNAVVEGMNAEAAANANAAELARQQIADMELTVANLTAERTALRGEVAALTAATPEPVTV